MVKQMRVGDIARDAGVSTRSIARFEVAGILPAPQRNASGQRVYSDAARATILTALALRRVQRLLGTQRKGAGDG